MKLFLSLAIIAAFATPVFAADFSVSQPANKIVAKGKKKKGKKGAEKPAAPAEKPAEPAAPAAPAEPAPTH